MLAEDRRFFGLEVYEWQDCFPKLIKCSLAQLRELESLVEAETEAAFSAGVKIIGESDFEYPENFRGLTDMPLVFYCKGDTDALRVRSVGVVGTREPTRNGKRTAVRVVKYFCENDWCVVSGLAAGVDAVAHDAALLCSGRTVAVLAHGLEKIYPKENERLAGDILDKGGVLFSEYAIGSPVFKSNFIERDKIQAGLSLGIVMVQSDESGGSWHASRAALNYGRVLAVPIPTDEDINSLQPKIRGNMKILHSEGQDLAVFLKCELRDLERLVVIDSKEKYPIIEGMMAGGSAC